MCFFSRTVFKIWVVVAMLAIVTAAEDHNNFIDTEPVSVIQESGLQNIPRRGFNVIRGWRHCGGAGESLDMRFPSCSGINEGPCEVSTDGQERAEEIDFIPGADIPKLAYQISAFPKDGSSEKITYETGIAKSEVKKGHVYTAKLAGPTLKALKGKLCTLQYEIFNTEDDVVQSCIRVNVKFV